MLVYCVRNTGFIMNGHLKSLEDVNALALPAKVLVLLSKYAQALRDHNGTILKLSSLRVFKHIHDTCEEANYHKLDKIYAKLLKEVNQHIHSGTMYTNDARRLMLKNKKKLSLKRFSKNIPLSAIRKNNPSTRIPSVDF